MIDIATQPIQPIPNYQKALMARLCTLRSCESLTLLLNLFLRFSYSSLLYRSWRLLSRLNPFDLDSLILFGGVHPIYFGFHRMLSKRFPFGIYYEVEDEVVYVYAILDLRRDPLGTRKQLRKRR
jgi:hypothetical protein